MNESGLRFYEFFNNHCLSLLNIWFPDKKCHRITWHSPDRVTKKVHDFILACSWLRQYLSNCRVYNSYVFDSDHRLVIADICTPCTKEARYVKRAAISTKRHVNLNCCLKRPDISKGFVNATLEKLENIDLNFTNSVMNDHLVSSIKFATEETLLMRGKTRLYQSWHSDIIIKRAV